MYNINVSLNKTLVDSMKLKLKKRGYSNISEYVRDLMRHDLHLVHDNDDYPYDYAYINQLATQANKEYQAGEAIYANSIDEAVAKIKK